MVYRSGTAEEIIYLFYLILLITLRRKNYTITLTLQVEK